MQALTRTRLKWEARSREQGGRVDRLDPWCTRPIWSPGRRSAQRPATGSWSQCRRGRSMTRPSKAWWREVTEQGLHAEKDGQDPGGEDGFRGWVIINEITDGNWASA